MRLKKAPIKKARVGKEISIFKRRRDTTTGGGQLTKKKTTNNRYKAYSLEGY